MEKQTMGQEAAEILKMDKVRAIDGVRERERTTRAAVMAIDRIRDRLRGGEHGVGCRDARRQTSTPRHKRLNGCNEILPTESKRCY